MDLMGKPNTTNFIILALSTINHKRTILIPKSRCMVTPRNKHRNNTHTFLPLFEHLEK